MMDGVAPDIEEEETEEESQLQFTCYHCLSPVFVNKRHTCFAGAKRILRAENGYLIAESGEVSNQPELELALKCGHCEAVIVPDRIAHGCFLDYTKLKIDDNGVCFVQFSTSKKPTDVQGDSTSPPLHQLKQESLKKNTKHSKSANSKSCDTTQSSWRDEWTELLIDEVKARPALWDYHLPMAMRSKPQTELLWSQVIDILKENFSISSEFCNIETITRKWEYLLTYFWRKDKLEKMSTGSAGGKERAHWKHEKQLMFLKEVQTNRSTTCNVNDNPDHQTQERIYRRTPKRARQEDIVINELKETVKKLQENTLQVPPPPPMAVRPTQLQSMFHVMESIMCEFPVDLQIDIMFQIFKILEEARNNHRGTVNK